MYFFQGEITGKELDTETGYYYFGARYLDPKTSRWISVDPAMGDYIPSAPVNDEARKRNGNLPGQGGVFNYVNLHVYHYAGNNPVKYMDPDGEKDKPIITGLPGVLPLVGTQDTGNNIADSLLAGLGNIWNTAASVINAPIRYGTELLKAADKLLTQLDDVIPNEYSLTGQGLKEDLFVASLFAGMNPGVVANSVQSAKSLPIVGQKPTLSFSEMVASSQNFSDIESAFFDVASKGAVDTYKTLAPTVNNGEKYKIIEVYWKVFINPD